MDSKRKLNGSSTAADDLDDRSAKRRKFPIDNKEETPETTKEAGLRFLEVIRKVEDKSGRQIALQFLNLPSKRALPEYYKVIKLPIAISTIEAKLRKHEFPSIAALEGYFRRMVQNAKEFNEKGSEVHEDAERLRKASSNWMTKNNPAYKINGYTPKMTPLPGEEVGEEAHSDEEAEPEFEIQKRKGRPPKNPKAIASRKSATPSLSGSQYGGMSFAGLTFQQAQEKIVDDMIHYKEDPEDEYSTFEVFLEVPDRATYPDYYTVILNPVSLTTLWQHVKGVRSKKDVTGLSDFNSWASFETEAAIIWKNACHYNEDGSEINELAKQMEVFFNKELAAAKKVVPEPAQPKIKLRMPAPASAPAPAPEPVIQPRITIKLPQVKASSAETSQVNGNGNSVPANGSSRRNPFGGSMVAAAPGLDQLERARSMSGSAASPTTANAGLVKHEGSRNSPAVLPGGQYGGNQAASSHGLNGNGMGPPLTPGLSQGHTQSGFAQSFNHQSHYQAPNPSFESKWRQPGKSASDAMITNLGLATHPGLHIPKHFRMDLPPSPTMAQQSITINLPSTHYYLQIKPTLAASLLDRQYKLFVTSGTTRLHSLPVPGQPSDTRHPLFEARLLPGVNRIEIELIAALPKGAPKPATGSDVEMEKITVFANLLKSS